MDQIDGVGIVAERGYPGSWESFLEQLLGPKDLSTVWNLASPRSVPCPCQAMHEDDTRKSNKSIHNFKKEKGSLRGRLTRLFALPGALLYWSDPVQAIAVRGHGNQMMTGRPRPFALLAFCCMKREWFEDVRKASTVSISRSRKVNIALTKGMRWDIQPDSGRLEEH